jgi:hypothetical protein
MAITRPGEKLGSKAGCGPEGADRLVGAGAQTINLKRQRTRIEHPIVRDTRSGVATHLDTPVTSPGARGKRLDDEVGRPIDPALGDDAKAFV